MFDGRDYQESFQNALNELTSEGVDRDVVLGQLVGIEFTLWEAIRGAMILTGNIAALMIIAPVAYLAGQTSGERWVMGVVCVVAWLLITFALYWIFKFAVYYEIGRHVKGRRFGDLDLP